jgi:adenylate cyclase
MRVRELAQRPEGLQIDTSHVEPWMVDFVYDTEIYVIAFILLLLAARAVYWFFSAKSSRPRLNYSPGNRTVDLLPNATLLESIRAAGISHASICGGRGRCSTCRVRIGDGAEDLSPPDEEEKKVLARVSDSPSVRLACQIRPKANIQITALVPHDANPSEAFAKPGYQQGKELVVAILFVDLRGSTKLHEGRLPFDVVFLLNQFFAELAQALSETNGHYAQFNGDGLMAIYGLDSGAEKGAAEAVAGALAMLRRLTKLNEKLGEQLSEELKIGIGIHTGKAIVGSMGPPASPIISALGDNANVAARLESQTKEFGVPLVVSADTARHSGIDFSKFPKHRIQVKGREGMITVYAVDKPEKLSVEL